jgi:hypothetical protein
VKKHRVVAVRKKHYHVAAGAMKNQHPAADAVKHDSLSPMKIEHLCVVVVVTRNRGVHRLSVL